MALINCPECNQQISDRAVSCPNCGYPLNYKPKQELPQNQNTNNTAMLPIQQPNNTQEVKYVIQEKKSTTYVNPRCKSRVGCKRCGSTDIIPIDTKKKFSVGKALIGNTVGGLVFGPVGAVVGAATGIKGKNGKTKFMCRSCGTIFERKV